MLQENHNTLARVKIKKLYLLCNFKGKKNRSDDHLIFFQGKRVAGKAFKVPIISQNGWLLLSAAIIVGQSWMADNNEGGQSMAATKAM